MKLIPPKVLITEEIDPILQQNLETAGCLCTSIKKITYQQVSEIIQHYNVLVVRSNIKVDKELINKGTKLKIIARAGSGMELIDTAYAQQNKITCLHSPEGNRDSVAEYCIGGLLSLLHNIARANNQMHQHQWHRKLNSGTELQGKTIAIIGFGNTGSTFAHLLQNFGVKILAFDKYKKNFAPNYVIESNLQHIFTEADIVSFHVPLNQQTHYYCNLEFLQQFKKNIYLLNTSRGHVCNTKHVIQALQTGKLKGALLDVFENENPETFSDLDKQNFTALTHQNVILTPHIAGITQQSHKKIAEVLSKKIIQTLINQQ